ncbi:hypothetical protein KEM48_011776 [Puccinia striiformis f. sp. tritici PST-130]|nr:hypothetical protein KEM48_011776 [Puccinia striiformis f. sp. tritici PST-130]
MSNKKVVCIRLPKLVTEDEREVCQKVWTDPKTGETSVYPIRLSNRHPKETAAPWVTGKKATEPSPSDLSVHSPRFALLQAARRGKSKRTREQLEEDEILQEVLEEEAAIARLTEAAKNQDQSQDQASESDSLLARHQYGRRCQHRLKEVRLDANKVPEEKDRLFIGVQTMKRRLTCFKIQGRIEVEGLKEEAKIVRRDLAEAVEEDKGC